LHAAQKEGICGVLNSLLFAVLGGLIGSELCVALFVHPTLYQVADETHLRVAQPLARLLGLIMPFWYFAVLVLGIAESILCRSPGCAWVYASTALVALSIVFSVTALVPINNQIALLNPAAPPENWLALRRRWDRLHRIRIAVLVLALVFLALG
jgi:hypothetical protein